MSSTMQLGTIVSEQQSSTESALTISAATLLRLGLTAKGKPENHERKQAKRVSYSLVDIGLGKE